MTITDDTITLDGDAIDARAPTSQGDRCIAPQHHGRQYQLDVNTILILAMTELPEQMHATRSVIESD